MRLSKLTRLQQRTEKILSSAKDELSSCLLSSGMVRLFLPSHVQHQETDPKKTTDERIVIAPTVTDSEKKNLTPDFASFSINTVQTRWRLDRRRSTIGTALVISSRRV